MPSITLNADQTVSVVYNDPLTVSWLSRHSDDALGRVGVGLVDAFCGLMRGVADADAGGRDDGSLLAFMHCMQKDMMTKLEDVCSQADSHRKELLSKVDWDLRSVVTTLEQVMKAYMEPITVSSISHRVSDTIREWLQSDVESLKRGHSLTIASVQELELRLHRIVGDVVGDAQQIRHVQLVGLLTGLPTQLTALQQQSPQDPCLHARVQELRGRLDDLVTTHGRSHADHQAVQTSLLGSVQNVATHLSASLDQRLTHLSDSLDQRLNRVLDERASQIQQVTTLLHETQKHLVKMEHDSLSSSAQQQRSSETLTTQVEALTVQRRRETNSNSVKGQKGESQLYDLLCERLTARQGYVIDAVHGVAHACDLNVRRQGRPDVRIEVKSHGELTGAKVGVKETTRFRSDLLSQNASGVFVSLYSDIVGIGKVEIQVLPNQKLAIFLSKNYFDVETISDMLQLIYTLESYMMRATGAADPDSDSGQVMRVGAEDMVTLQRHMDEYGEKVKTVIGSLRNSIILLKEMTFVQLTDFFSSRRI